MCASSGAGKQFNVASAISTDILAQCYVQHKGTLWGLKEAFSLASKRYVDLTWRIDMEASTHECIHRPVCVDTAD
jgi:hypothetical protein